MSEHGDKQYSYTKGMRFRLKHARGELPEPDTAIKADLTGLCAAGERLAGELEKFIYQPQAENPEALAHGRQGEYRPSRIATVWSSSGGVPSSHFFTIVTCLIEYGHCPNQTQY